MPKFFPSARRFGKSVKASLKKVTFRPYVKRKTIEGIEFDFLIGNTEGRDWYDINSTDPIWHEMRHMRDLLIRKGDVVFELGSHHGCTTILLANWVGATGKVVAFEPSPANIGILKKNVEINRLGNVVVKQQAVGESSKTARFAKSAILPEDRNKPFDNVEMVCIDQYAEFKPTVLKLDVQGYEGNVLKGAKRILQTRPKLAIEIHCSGLKKYGHTIDGVLGLLNLSEYESYILYSDEAEVVQFGGDTERMKNYDYAHLFATPKKGEA